MPVGDRDTRKGGRFTLHGEGATLRWKPGRKKAPGPDGTVGQYKREYYYTCDLNMESKKKMKQLRMSFTTATKKTAQE